MKRVYIICLFLAGIIGISAYLYGYRYFVQADREEVTKIESAVMPETIEAAVQDEIRLTKNTQYYIETYHIEKNSTIREVTQLPTEVIGSNRKQFVEYLEKMMERISEEGLLSIELANFTQDEVVVRKTYKEPKDPYEFYLDVQMGRVIVKNTEDDSLYAYTEIKFETLPEDLKREILRGYSVENLEELYEFLETYSS